MQHVADAVGVSRSTVFNAYSRPDQLSTELRARILDAAGRLGYAGPHPTARSLRRGRAGAIGVLFTDALSQAFTDPYAVHFLRGLAQTAERYRVGLLLLPLSEDHDRAVRAVNDAVVDGFCVFCVPDWHRALATIRSRGLPVVSANEPRDDGPDSMFVGIDERAAASVMATRTSAPCFVSRRTSSAALKAAMPPVMPSRIFFPFNVIPGALRPLRGKAF